MRRVHSMTLLFGCALATLAVRAAFSQALEPALEAPAADAAAKDCAVSPGRFDDVELNPLRSTICNLPMGNPLPRRGDRERALSRMRGERLQISFSRDGVPADGQSAVTVRVAALDRDGAAITRPLEVTVETSGGRIVSDDTHFTRRRPKFLEDRDRRQPGTQLVLENGVAEFVLLAPYEPQDVVVRASAGEVEVTEELSFVPDPRPAIAVGLVEGQLHVSDLNRERNTPLIRDDGLEATLSELDRDDSASGSSTAYNGRAAFFYKGALGRGYLLTAAYDSDKDRVRLFRDIQPDQFYPIYGDSSIKGFDAQSTRRGYLRLDKNKSYLLFGDFNSETGANELRDLGVYSRSLTGFKQHVEQGRLEFTLWAARDSVRQIIDEQPGRGVSGPYAVSNPNGIANSEKVEIIVRDRAQPAIILSVEPLIRFADYEFEPFSGQLLFRKPIPSLDANLNPVSIRVTFEVDEGGPEFFVGGAQARFKPADSFELGLSYATADDPSEPYALGGVNAAWRLGRNTVWIAEAARSERDGTSLQVDSRGHGLRTELRHLSQKLDARAFYGRTTNDFDNPAASLNGGRNEAGGKLTYRFSEGTDLTAEVLDTQDAQVGASRFGASVMLGHWFNEWFRVDAGFRYFDDDVAAASPSGPRPTFSQVYSFLPPGSIGAGAFVNGAVPSAGQNTTARLKFSAKAAERSLLYIEGEQGLDDDDAYAVALGGDYQLSEQARLYARHEYAKSLSSLYGLNEDEARRATVFGVDSAYMRNGSLFSEYRMRSAIPGREAEAALGLRNLWPVRPGLAVSTAFERVQVLEGPQGEATAMSFGVESTWREIRKSSARFEYRTDDVADSFLSTLAYTRKLSRDWSLLARNLYSETRSDDRSLGDRRQNRGIVGLAYRETDRNLWNALMRYEIKLERAAIPGDELDRRVHVASAHFNYRPRRPLTIAGQLAGKWVDETFGAGALEVGDRYDAWLGSGRLIYDLTERWDVGLQVGGLFDSAGGQRYGLGLETGYALVDNLWLSVGFNFIGFEDDDLVESDYTRRGFYLRLRFKFDEKLFKGRDSRWNNTLVPEAGTRSE